MSAPVRLFHTLRYLKPVQIFGRVFFRLYHPKVDQITVPERRERRGVWRPHVARGQSQFGPALFRLLNETHEVRGRGDWNNPAWSKLWLYNLHYFDDLVAERAAERSAWHGALVERWIAENPVGQGNGWEPYPISMRLVNWIKWALAGHALPGEVLLSMAVQARYLRRRLEYHLLGNHLLANAKALVFAGLFFDGPEAREWLGKGLSILGRELPEQILPDGGHFERSPMYHALILEDLLDLVNLFQAYGCEVSVDWLDACIVMRAWLKALTHPDGEIALFNDAAFGIAPDWAQLDAYAGRLGLDRQEYPPRLLTRFAETGYVRCENENAVLLLDVAPIGPDYLPGHAHADTLCFELSLFGQRVIVDSGTSTYEKNDERQRQRGTAAHNTVTIGGRDSSEVWGGFRVARRARPFGLKIDQGRDEARIACSHDGYRRLPGRPVHSRTWTFGPGGLTVSDQVSGGVADAVARYYFHPEVEISLAAGRKGQGKLKEGKHVAFEVLSGRAMVRPSTWHPEFNSSLANTCLEIELEGGTASVCFDWS